VSGIGERRRNGEAGVIGDGSAGSTVATWQARLVALRALLEQFPMALLQLMFRVGIGAVFWNSGLTKIASWQTTVVLFRDEYKVPLLPPELAAMLGASVELTCPVLLVLGLATRLATLPMLGMTFVIEAFVYPQDWIEHLIWASLLLAILTRGPGAIALDRWLAPLLLGRGHART
jgi:putative oxidoreductase